MSVAEFEADVVVDAGDCILGRVASKVAQKALDDERIAVVNAENAVITGSEDDVMGTFEKRVEVGTDRGPYYPKRPDRIFKRAIRGMIPYKRNTAVRPSRTSASTSATRTTMTAKSSREPPSTDYRTSSSSSSERSARTWVLTEHGNQHQWQEENRHRTRYRPRW